MAKDVPGSTVTAETQGCEADNEESQVSWTPADHLAAKYPYPAYSATPRQDKNILNRDRVEGTPDRHAYPGDALLDTPPKPTSSAPPIYSTTCTAAKIWGYGDLDDHPVEEQLAHMQKCTIEATSSLVANRKRDRALFEDMNTRIVALSASELDALKRLKIAEAETKRAKLITVSEVARLEAEIRGLKEANAVAQGLVKEIDSLKDRVQEAASLEKANEGLGKTILALKKELADAETEVNDLHNGILTVVSNHTKKARKSVG